MPRRVGVVGVRHGCGGEGVAVVLIPTLIFTCDNTAESMHLRGHHCPRLCSWKTLLGRHCSDNRRLRGERGRKRHFIISLFRRLRAIDSRASTVAKTMKTLNCKCLNIVTSTLYREARAGRPRVESGRWHQNSCSLSCVWKREINMELRAISEKVGIIR